MAETRDLRRRKDGTRLISNQEFTERLEHIRRDIYVATADRFTTGNGLHNKLCRDVIRALDLLWAHAIETPLPPFDADEDSFPRSPEGREP